MNITDCMKSNLITMSICAGHDPRQAVGEPYTIPPHDIRLLRAKLILEETLETIHALGYIVVPVPPVQGEVECQPEFNYIAHDGGPDLNGIIDGCCDLNYVLTGTLVSCGVPDAAHIQAVCMANETKFPGGVATFNESGKYQKPEGWKGPDHEFVKNFQLEDQSLKSHASLLLKRFKNGKR